MKKLILISVSAALLAAPVAGAGGNSIQIRMKDPGCHWFYSGGKYSTKYSTHGPVTIQNFDEATLKFVGPGGTKFEKVGKTLTLRLHGTYHITMVGQASDDNHLKLVVR
jgi:hypothetical protein